MKEEGMEKTGYGERPTSCYRCGLEMGYGTFHHRIVVHPEVITLPPGKHYFLSAVHDPYLKRMVTFCGLACLKEAVALWEKPTGKEEDETETVPVAG